MFKQKHDINKKTQNLSPTLNKSYAKMVIKLLLHLKWYSSIMSVNFYLEPKEFSALLNPDSFSHGGECHRPWYTGGKHIPPKWRDSLKASRWSKRRWSVITQSHNHPTSNGSDI